jgi:hypothetical protein
MEYVLKERIGKPELFVGRTEEMAYFLKWITNIKKEMSQSTAILARRKMGKTALMERLFNITFYKNDGVIPFYYEIKETEMWVLDFCKSFFLTFIYQYIAFKSRNPEYLNINRTSDFDEALKIAKKEKLGYLSGIIKDAARAADHESIDILWEIAREAPKTIAAGRNEFIIQLIDEFQFLNSMIYWDKTKTKLADKLAGGYLSTAESKIAPLLVSGSWVGWLMNLLNMMLPARFEYHYLENMPESEALEMVFKFSQFFEVPVTEETAYLLVQITEGSPFYISSVIRSLCPNKDIKTIDGLTRALEFETLNDRGKIKATWMEYIASAFPKINDRNTKNIVLHLSKYRDRELTREEILKDLDLHMSDGELERKLKALVKSGIIKQGATNFDYQGVQDNIFDKVFRGVYQKEIDHFDLKIIGKEYSETLEKLKSKYNLLLGKFNYQKGIFAEYLILDQLKFRAKEKNELLKSITHNLPVDFNFTKYSSVWRYDTSPEHGRCFNVDIFACSQSPGDYSIIGEVKSRDLRKFSKDEVIECERKFAEVKKIEKIDRVIGFIFSRSGFTKEAEDYCREKGIAWSDDEKWLDVS